MYSIRAVNESRHKSIHDNGLRVANSATSNSLTFIHTTFPLNEIHHLLGHLMERLRGAGRDSDHNKATDKF
jgi:hypothetical protein